MPASLLELLQTTNPRLDLTIWAACLPQSFRCLLSAISLFIHSCIFNLTPAASLLPFWLQTLALSFWPSVNCYLQPPSFCVTPSGRHLLFRVLFAPAHCLIKWRWTQLLHSIGLYPGDCFSFKQHCNFTERFSLNIHMIDCVQHRE